MLFSLYVAPKSHFRPWFSGGKFTILRDVCYCRSEMSMVC
jgi:hypothetical protein